MKITGISSVVVNARMRNWIFVKVETDQPGLYGWGEATLEWKTKAVVGAIEDLRSCWLGRIRAVSNTCGRSCTASISGAAGSSIAAPSAALTRRCGTSREKKWASRSANCSGARFAIPCASTTILGAAASRECTRPSNRRSLPTASGKSGQGFHRSESDADPSGRADRERQGAEACCAVCRGHAQSCRR